MQNTERFSNRAKNYVRYRPHYPGEIIPFLKEKIKFNDRWMIADIGSGTGISSELFLKNGNRVYGVEPNKEMRESAEAIFKKDKNFISVDATAEATSLPIGSINLIVAGQAFHWFDKTACKKEFQRIAAPGAYLLLMWNDRKLNSPFQQAYEQMLKELAIDYEEVNQRNVDEEVIKTFFSPYPYFLQSFPNSQYFDLEGLKGRLLSCSYAPPEHHENYQPIMRRLDQIFEKFNTNSKVEFAYNCNIYCGHIGKA